MSTQTDNIQNLDNPVKRLYHILDKARTLSPDISMRYVWADALGVKRDDPISLYIALADLIQLYQLAKKVIEEFDDVNQIDYIKAFEPIGFILSNVNLDDKWDRWRSRLNETTMLLLKMAANTISAKLDVKELDPDELKEIQDEAEKLFENVLKSDFESEDLKKIILEYLEGIIQSIRSYRINGVDGLRRAVDATIGAILSRKQLIEDAIQSDEKKVPLFRDLVGLLANLSQIASFGIQVSQITGYLPPLLGPGG